MKNQNPKKAQTCLKREKRKVLEEGVELEKDIICHTTHEEKELEAKEEKLSKGSSGRSLGDQ